MKVPFNVRWVASYPAWLMLAVPDGPGWFQWL